jgi:hypothetical protein
MVGSCRGVFKESIVKHLMRVVIATKRTINVGLK